MHAILCFGDSITHGRGENPSISWVGRLKNDFESKHFYNVVYNLGVPGETSFDLLKRFETEAKNRIKYLRKEDKFVIIIAIGINDSGGRTSSDNNDVPKNQFERNIRKLIKISKKYTKNIIFISLTPINEKLVHPFEGTYFSNSMIQKYNKIIEQNCSQKACEYVNIFDELKKKNFEKKLQDGIHPNSEGYKIMYNIISTKLEEKKLLS